ncbi:MAG: flavodoxin family protein [Patescibacteria group bacterium]|nr:flavodoxin family protein [Patescibacteria group bacterium]
MNIVAICGSPRNGNTEFTLKRILTKASELGASTELVLLREKRIEFCDGCLSCESSGKCKTRDDMQIIYPRLENADLIIFGSPNYFSNMTGMMKNFVDRMNPYYTNKALNEKKMVVAVIGETNNSNSVGKVINSFEAITNSFKMSFVGDLFLSAKGSQDVENSPDDIKKIDEFAEGLIGND